MYYSAKPKKVHLRLTMKKSQVLLEEVLIALIFAIGLGLISLSIYSVLFDQELLIELAIRAGAVIELLIGDN